MKTFIILGIFILIFVIVFGLYSLSEKNIDNDYKLEVIAIANGTDEFGNNLNETVKRYEYSITNNLIFYETYSNDWTTINNENIVGKILTIKKINKNNIIVETNNGEINIKYGEKNSINSLIFVADGLNYIYDYRIIR